MNNFSKVIFLISCIVSLQSTAQNKILDFDGVNDYLDLGSTAGNNIRTIEMWFNSDQHIDSNLSNFSTLVYRETSLSSSPPLEFGVFFDPIGAGKGKIRFFMSNILGSRNEILSDSNQWNANQWYHVAAVVHPVNGMRLYINGIQQNDSNNYTGHTGTSAHITAAGKWGNLNFRYFDGSIDDLKFHNKAVYTANFIPQCPDSNSRIADHGNWNFNGIGNLAIDSNFTNYHANIVGAIRASELICTQFTVGLPSNNNSEQDILAIPNPTNRFVKFIFEGETNINSSVQILDVTGKEISRSAVNTNSKLIDLESFSNGMYFYNIYQNGDRIKSGKIIKQ